MSRILKRTHIRDTRMHNNQTQKAGFKPGEMTYLKLCRGRQTESNSKTRKENMGKTSRQTGGQGERGEKCP